MTTTKLGSSTVRYIIGVAMRLAVDLGLHSEEGNDGDSSSVDLMSSIKMEPTESHSLAESTAQRQGQAPLPERQKAPAMVVHLHI